MKHTKNNIIKLIESMSETSYNIAKNTENIKLKEDSYKQWMAYDTVLMLFNDEEYFNHLCEIYNIND